MDDEQILDDEPTLALSTHGLRKAFGDFIAVAGIDLAVPRGSFYGFLGPNGAGKSTTIKCLTGLLTPTAGRVEILGRDPLREPVQIKRLVGVVPEDLALFEHLTARETLDFVGRIHGLEPGVIASRSDELLQLLTLDAEPSTLATELSHGMKKKLALATALLPAPRLIFLDEPFEGIDTVASRLVRQLLATFVEGGGTVFLTSHILEIVERLCDHISVIDRGQLVAQGTIEELRAGGASGSSLEELFLGLVGGDQDSVELTWLN
jgi:ABC-2 type transport system ATP-binding protein